MIDWWLYSLAGAGVGFIVGLTGIGGGALMTPLLVMGFGVAPTFAVGTDLLFASITKLFGAAVHGRHGTIDWLIVRRLAIGSLPAAGLTTAFLAVYGHQKIGQGLIIHAIGAALVLTAGGLLLKNQLHKIGRRLRTDTPTQFKALQPALTIAAGAVLGVLVAMTSVGAGALGTVMMVYLYPYRMTPAKLVGTDLAHALPLALVAGLGHLIIGNVDFQLLGLLLLGSIPGVLIGSMVSTRAPSVWVARAIAVVLAIVGVRLLA
jgi:uncharacterized membrane protein YfcA